MTSVISAMVVQAALNRSQSKGSSGIWGWYVMRAAWNWMYAIIGWWTAIVLPVCTVALVFIKKALKDVFGFGDD